MDCGGFREGRNWGRSVRGAMNKCEAQMKKSEDLAKAVSKTDGLKKQKTQMESLQDTLKEEGVLKDGGNSDLTAALAALTPAERIVHSASIEADRRTLKADAWIPFTLAIIYLGILLYFKSIGGYKPVTFEGEEMEISDAGDKDDPDGKS